MTSPAFTFNEKTGELARGGKLIALRRLHAEIFDAVAYATAPLIFERLQRRLSGKLSPRVLGREVAGLNRRIKPLGLAIEAVNGGNVMTMGRRLVVNEMPKWKPTIPAPAEVPFP